MPYDQNVHDEVLHGRAYDEEIESCHYLRCKLEEVDLSDLLIVDTTFEDCDLRMVRLGNTRLQRVRFVKCRLTGAAFASASDFALELHFDECDLSYASFTETGLQNTSFAACTLTGADFTGANLSGADLTETDLADATFERTNLEKADLRGATNFDIDPERNRVRGARFDRNSLGGLLRKYGLKLD